MAQILEFYKAGLVEIEEEWAESLLVQKVFESFKLAPTFILEVDGRAQGMAGFTVVKTEHSGRLVMCDYIFYIRPKYRNIKTLGALVKAAQEFSKEQDMALHVEFILNDDEGLRKRVLEIHGFKAKAILGEYRHV